MSDINLPSGYRDRCPLLNRQGNTCLASNRALVSDERLLLRYCNTDNHDNCPTLLTYLLLHSSTKSRHSCQDEFLTK